MKTVLITGAAGNLGSKLRQHLEGRYELRLLDRHDGGDSAITVADLSQWDERWVKTFQGVDAVVHLAANPNPNPPWHEMVESNCDTVLNTYLAAVQGGVGRVVFASSNHAMGQYKDVPEPHVLGMETPPRPGTHWERDGEKRDTTPYGALKLVGERIGKTFADAYGLSTIAVRIGWVRRGENLAADLPEEVPDWLRLMWLSNRDFCQIMERCIEGDPSIRFAVVNGMSANTGMRWDIDFARDLIGYEPQDDVTKG